MTNRYENEAEIIEKLKLFEERGRSPEEFISSFPTANFEKILLLKWVLGEYEYPSGEVIIDGVKFVTGDRKEIK